MKERNASAMYDSWKAYWVADQYYIVIVNGFHLLTDGLLLFKAGNRTPKTRDAILTRYVTASKTTDKEQIQGICTRARRQCRR